VKPARTNLVQFPLFHATEMAVHGRGFPAVADDLSSTKKIISFRILDFIQHIVHRLRPFVFR
jgi:hypothetical protein